MAKNKEQTRNLPGEAPRRAAFPGHPLAGLRQQMDRLFDDFMPGWGVPRAGSFFDLPASAFGGGAIPHLDVVENDKELMVTAELPGLDEKDVEVTLDQGVLTIRGEKKSESERKEDRITVSERRYGSFSRSVALPEGIDEEKVRASFDKGVLTVRVGRRPEALRQAKRIPIG